MIGYLNILINHFNLLLYILSLYHQSLLSLKQTMRLHLQLVENCWWVHHLFYLLVKFHSPSSNFLFFQLDDGWSLHSSNISIGFHPTLHDKLDKALNLGGVDKVVGSLSWWVAVGRILGITFSDQPWWFNFTVRLRHLFLVYHLLLFFLRNVNFQKIKAFFVELFKRFLWRVLRSVRVFALKLELCGW